MIDPELKHHLEKIEGELKDFHKASFRPSLILFRGSIYGAGTVLGAVLVVIIVGWILNIIGVIPAFADQVNEFRAALDRFSTPVK